VALAEEARVLGIDEPEARRLMRERLDVMLASVEQGLRGKCRMPLLEPTAHLMMAAQSRGDLVLGGPHARAAARALAVTHVNNSLGVVCAAPTAGSAAVIPAVLSTLAEELSLSREDVILPLFAAGAIGAVIAGVATFAAETGGCQVEIGAACAMAAAAVVEIADGSAEQATDAAAIALQNAMGSICDPVQGGCEIPCHTRNAAAASSAIICAELILGGYRNPIPLDETIDAVRSVGDLMAPELRCTARGGIALCPSAQPGRLPKR
jgi:L-serine dehydratase